MFNWLIEKSRSLMIFCFIILIILVLPTMLLYIISICTKYILVDIVTLSNTVYFILNILITVAIIFLLMKYVLTFDWSISYTNTKLPSNGVIDSNLSKMTVSMLIEKLEEYDDESLVLLKDNHIAIIDKDSIKLKED